LGKVTDAIDVPVKWVANVVEKGACWALSWLVSWRIQISPEEIEQICQEAEQYCFYEE
jgi:hypothetical protein